MRSLALFTSVVGLALVAGTTAADDSPLIFGVVTDSCQKPLANVTVSEMWRANGSGTTPDGTLFNLSDEKQLAEFWGNLGDMQTFPNRRAMTRSDGSFDVRVRPRSRVLIAMDSTRQLGGIAPIPEPYTGQSVEIRLVPLVTVHGRMRSAVGGKSVDWSHVYVELPEDPKLPLTDNRIVSCGSFDGRFRFRLPPGHYVLNAYAISKPNSDDIDLAVQPSPTFTIDRAQRELDLGDLFLTDAPLDRLDLESAAKVEGRWKDFTKHYGERAPDWYAVDARGISKDATIADFRGKWLLIEFWGFECAPCLSSGIPKLMDFYHNYAKHRDRFEIVGICIDYSGKLKTMHDIDAAMAPLVKHVWKGRTIEFPIVLDNTFKTWERYGIPGLGTVVLVSPDGQLLQGDETTLATALERGAEQGHETQRASRAN